MLNYNMKWGTNTEEQANSIDSIEFRLELYTHRIEYIERIKKNTRLSYKYDKTTKFPSKQDCVDLSYNVKSNKI